MHEEVNLHNLFLVGVHPHEEVIHPLWIVTFA